MYLIFTFTKNFLKQDMYVMKYLETNCNFQDKSSKELVFNWPQPHFIKYKKRRVEAKKAENEKFIGVEETRGSSPGRN